MQPNFDSPPNSPLSPDAEPLQVDTQAAAADEEPSVDPEEMQIVPAYAYNTTPFELPDDWIVEVRPRGPNSPIHSDKYYYEPGTGRKFRSLLSVKRYLTGEEEPPKRPPPRSQESNCLVPYHNSGSFKRVIYGGKVLRPDELESARHLKLEEIHPETLQFKWADTLPDGWIVEEIPRKCGFRSDRYFIDPVSEQRFRSIPEVHRFLEAQRRKRKSKALALSNRSTAPQSSLSRKKSTSPKKSKNTDSDIAYCPDRINWVYSGDGRDNWSPLLEQCAIPDYMKEQWSETFLLGMTGLKHQLPQLTMKESNSG